MLIPVVTIPMMICPVWNKEIQMQRMNAYRSSNMRQIPENKCKDKMVSVALVENNQIIQLLLTYAEGDWIGGWILANKYKNTYCDGKYKSPSECTNKWTRVTLTDGKVFWFYITYVNSNKDIWGFIHKSLYKSLRCTLKIALQANNGQYVCAEGGGGRELVANRNVIGTWETFTLIPQDMQLPKYALQANNGEYVCAEGGGGHEVVANRKAIGPWEIFNLKHLGDNKFALQADNGQYVCAEGGGGRELVANRNAIGPWETFALTILK